MYHLTSPRNLECISNLEYKAQQNPMQSCNANLSHRHVMNHNNTMYHDSDRTKTHAQYGQNIHYPVQPQRSQVASHCGVNAFSDFQNERVQPIYAYSTCDQTDCVHHNQVAQLPQHNCCNPNVVVSRAALCTLNQINPMNMNMNTNHTQYWTPQTSPNLNFSQTAAQVTSDHNCCGDHNHPQNAVYTTNETCYDNINAGSDPRQLSDTRYSEYIDNNLYTAGYIMNSPVNTHTESASNDTTPCNLSPRCESNMLTDSTNSHSQEFSFESTIIPKGIRSNIHLNNDLKPESKVFPSLSLPQLTSSSDRLLSATQKEMKSNRGRKKIDRSQFLNVDGRYQCKLCPKSYKRYNDLKGHNAVHSDDTECCPHCKKKFSRPIYLRDHIRTHTGEKPFNCDICHKQFAAKRNLVQHRKRHFRANSRLIGSTFKST